MRASIPASCGLCFSTWHPHSIVPSVLLLQPTMIHTEGDAMRDVSIEHPEIWRFANTAEQNVVGYPTSFEIMAGETGVSLLVADAWPQMPIMWHEITLRPFDFYKENPGMDLPMQP